MSNASGQSGWASWRRTLPCIIAVILAVAGCATRVPQVLSPDLLPQSFARNVAESERVWPQPEWWRSFGSAELSDLIASAQGANRDLAAAAARILEARAQVAIRRSILFPQANLQVQAQRGGRSANGTTTFGNSSTTNSSAGNSFAINAGASYALDIWGLEHDNLRAARESLKSQRFAQQAVALTVTANVAGTYFSVLVLRERMAIANEDITAINSILDVIKLKVSAGTSSHLDLAQEQAQVQSVEAQLPILEQQELESRVSLAVLIGRTPEGFDVAARDPNAIRPPAVAAGMPSDLLLRRPDVAQAEANLAAAHANLDAARAAFFPQFNVSGSAGYSGSALGMLIRGSNLVWDAGANLLQTIFDGGNLIGQAHLAEATQKELIADYQSAVLNAYADVENALGQVANNSKAEEHLRREVDAAQQAFEIAQLQYRQGAADLLNLLQAQQTLFNARDQLAQTRLARLQAMVHLYAALGGGWLELTQDSTQLARGSGLASGSGNHD